MSKRSINTYYELLTAALSLQKGLGNVAIKEYFQNNDVKESFKDGFFLIRKKKLAIKLLEQDLRRVELVTNRYGVKLIPIWSEVYPESLKHTHDPPACLYYLGERSLLDKLAISVVGTRRSSEYGARVTKDLVGSLVSKNFVIVSGMAMGIDAIAHQSCLQNDGRTIAVLVGGPHKSSPACNTTIYEKILSNDGLIISENLPGTKIHPSMFASRNRIVAGLSSGTIVIEADENSGSLITAELAVDLGKHVFAVPGNINLKQSRGTNSLIKKGHAKLVQSANDILEEFGFAEGSLNVQQKLDLTPKEESIYDLLLKGKKTMDELQNILSIERGAILSLCTKLEFRNIIYKDIAGRYSIV